MAALRLQLRSADPCRALSSPQVRATGPQAQYIQSHKTGHNATRATEIWPTRPVG